VILLTGASGFLGRHLLQTISGEPLRAAVRKPSALISSAVDQVVVGDMGPATDWASALSDVRCVVHLAARVHVMNPGPGDAELFNTVNVLGTERLASMAAASGVKRFVYLSSIKVNGEGTSGKAFTSEDVPAPEDDYGRSKLLAEQRLFAVAERTGMQVVVIRPPLMYGPGVKANFRRLLHWIHAGVPLPLGAVQNRRSMASVWNVCDLIATIVARSESTAGVYLVSDDNDLSTPELIRGLASGMDRRARLLNVPVGLLTAMGDMLGKAAEVSRLCGSLVVDIERTKHQLGWSPPLSAPEGLRRVAQWYEHEGRLRED